jgi:uncharacterized protein (DUF1800 family)
MPFMIRVVALLAVSLGIAAEALGAEPTARAIEFADAAGTRYFVTSDPAEIRAYDSAGSGWKRTGGEFGVYARAGDAPGSVAVCRFLVGPRMGTHARYFTADAAECDSLKTLGWRYEGVAFYILPASGAGCGAEATAVYRSIARADYRNDLNQRFVADATVQSKVSAAGYSDQGIAWCAPLSADDRLADAVRLMRQATFGPRPGDSQHAASIGAAAWIDEQLALPPTQYPVYSYMPANRPDSCVDDRTQPVRPDSFCARDNYTLFPLQVRFFANALSGPDQLRQRVAFALSQIMVASGVDNARNYAMRHYQQIFLDKAFGSFHDLLLAVTLSPVMGDYLDMVNNNKSNPAAGTDPNENYAREILQLFSVGTYLLNADGSRQLDSGGKPRFTYELADIKGFSRVFTGWTYAPITGIASRNNNPRNYLGTMVAVDANHEFGTKVLLNGVVAPANMTMAQDLEFAHQNIVQHPNVGPFIGRQLIQKLVTSEPSPAYVARITAVFNDNGAGVRGDLKAVVRAILLDTEARGARKIDPAYGKLVEPVLYMTSVARAGGAASDGVALRASSQALGQFVFYAPSVFNYYPFDYVVPGTPLLGPEFGVQTSTTSMGRVNFATGLVFTNAIAPDATVFGATGTTLDLSRYQALAQDAGALADGLSRDLLNGTMPAAMRDAIVTAVNAASPTDGLTRARTAYWLVVTSPQFQVQR